jgi:hypothetical protein
MGRLAVAKSSTDATQDCAIHRFQGLRATLLRFMEDESNIKSCGFDLSKS